jgi:PPOX class probable F420-dependent enzyme
MTDEEVVGFLAEERLVSVATIGPRGRPHLVPLFYRSDGLDVLAWTYGASQKSKNLERDPRATIQVEAGEAYVELRGVMMECDVEIERDPERVLALGLWLAERFGSLSAAVEAGIRAQAPKRVGLRFHPTRIVSWDHRKL